MPNEPISIGRIVHYKLDSGAIRPAIVTDVDTFSANLAVFTDVSDQLPCPLLVRGKIEGTGVGEWTLPEVPARKGGKATLGTPES
jgi:hypothetical protein